MVMLVWKGVHRLAVFVLMLIIVDGCGQSTAETTRVMFYNVENFFDPFDDSLTKDEEFTPAGSRHWTYSRFMDKAVKIARVVLAAGDPDPPAIIGLAELENQFVLEKLVYDTPLRKYGYAIIHEDSPDRRGIDVGMIYRKDLVRLDTFYYIPVNFDDTSSKTREILLASFVLPGNDTLWVSVNHWPSRYGGAGATAKKRLVAARTAKTALAELLGSHPGARIVVVGDFNDEPADESMKYLVSWEQEASDPGSLRLVNLGPRHGSSGVQGTIKHGGLWAGFDQVLVSENMIRGSRGLRVKNKEAAIFGAAFLLEADNSHLGRKPFRTYQGPAYHGGFSDHLPVYVDISKP